MFAECTIQYDTKKGGNIYVFVEKQILVLIWRPQKGKLANSADPDQML